MPSAMSRPSEPVEMVSTSIALLFLPSRMIEPLPKLRSICDSAASRALDLSMAGFSTTLSEAEAIATLPYDRVGWDSEDGGPNPVPLPTLRDVCTLFVPCSQYVLFWKTVPVWFVPSETVLSGLDFQLCWPLT